MATPSQTASLEVYPKGLPSTSHETASLAPGTYRMAIYGRNPENGNKYLDDLFEGTKDEVMGRFYAMYSGVKIEQVMAYDVNGQEIPKIKVFWSNMGWYSQEEFIELPEAVKYARGVCFEAAFHQNGEVLGAWSPIGGYRSFKVS